MSEPAETSAPRPRFRRQKVVGAAAVLAGLAGAVLLGVQASRRPPPSTPGRSSTVPPDPRLAYTGPLANIRPDVSYEGDASCARCHADKAATYRQHPMGQTLQPIAAVAGTQEYGPKQNNPFTAFGATFQVEREGDRVRHRQVRRGADGQPLAEFTDEVHFVIGSGNHGRSYLTSRDGYLYQTAISWFSRKQRWDLSPGFEPAIRYGRPIELGCLFCHSNRARHVEGSLNHFQEPIFEGHSIGCERCHGPGQRHAQTTRRDDIVNPGRLEWRLREAVCEQCHLEGEIQVVRRGRDTYDFRPGLPLESFRSIFVRATGGAEDRKAVNHVEQLYLSGCFRGTSDARKLGCISCHDPHVRVGPETRVAYYRGKCLSCHGHEAPECSLPLARRREVEREDSCIACHMPRFSTSDIPHTASTDHRIPRRPEGPSGEEAGGPMQQAGFPIRNFYADRLSPGDREAERDLGIALVTLARQGRLAPERYSRTSVELLESALNRAPDDLDAWEAKGEIFGLTNRPLEALAAFENVLARAPQRETSLTGAAAAAKLARQSERGLDYLRRAVAVNPWNPLYRACLVRELAASGAWDEVGFQSQEWLRLAPEDAEARRFRIDWLERNGRTAEARQEAAKAAGIHPPE